MGKQQSGILNLKIADLVKDKDILPREHAIKICRKRRCTNATAKMPLCVWLI
jgi:RecG-like helicase